MHTHRTIAIMSLLLSFLALAAAGHVVSGRIADAQPSADRVVIQVPAKVEIELGDEMHKLGRRMGVLWYAGQAGNTELGMYELHEMLEVINTIVEADPIENGVQLAGVLNGLKQTQLLAVGAALETRDKAAFEAAYQDTVATCNGCHQSIKHAFIKIQVPTAPPAGNRAWDFDNKKALAILTSGER